MRCHLFVTHIDNFNPLIETSIINIDDVSATQREDGVDTFMLQALATRCPPEIRSSVASSLVVLITSLGHDGSPHTPSLIRVARSLVWQSLNRLSRCKMEYSDRPDNGQHDGTCP